MIKKGRITAFLTAAAMSAFIFAGCTQKSDENEDVTGTTAASSETTLASSASEETVEQSPESDSLNSLVKYIVADETIGDLVAADTTFTVVLNEDMEADELKSYLRIVPDMDFLLDKTSECTYKLKPKNVFDKNSMTSLSLIGSKGEAVYRWAFQTECDMAVDEVYPAAGSEYVGLDTGIEITFTCPVDAADAEKYISISPEVKGKFRTHRNNVYFIPNGELNPRTNYYVTVSSELPSIDGEALGEEYKFSFKTSAEKGNTYFYTTDMSETFLEGDPVVVEVYASDNVKNKRCSVELYRYPDEKKYEEALVAFVEDGRNNDDYTFPVSELESVYSNSMVEMIQGEDSWGPSYILLPDNLEQGGYLAVINAEANGFKMKIQRHIQVNPISVYAGSLSGGTDFFINDTITGNAANGAQITLKTASHTYSATADSSGIARINIEEQKSGRGVMTVSYGSNVYCDVFEYTGDEKPSPRDDYLMYLYTDREAYLSTDTINIWGVIRPRKNGVTIPDDLSVVIDDNSYYYYYADDTDISGGTSADVKMMPDGTFTAQISIENHENMWTNLCLSSGGEVLLKKYISIQEYEKPIYIIEAENPEYAISPQTDAVPVSISATLYDETPVSGIGFEVTTYNGTANPKFVSTDSDGKASTSIIFNDSNEWEPFYNSYEVRLSGIENTYNEVYKSVYSFYRDVMLQSEFDEDAKTFTVYTNKINFDKISDLDLYSYSYPRNYEPIKGDAYDTEVTARLTRCWYEKVEKGTRYDYLQKKNVTKYEYQYRTEVVGEYTINTKNGVGALTSLPIDDKSISYYFDLSYKDSKGRTVECTRYSDSGMDMYYQSDYKKFRLQPSGTSFKENDTMHFDLYMNGSVYEENEGKVFYQVYGTDLIESGAFDGTSFDLKYQRKYIPTVSVCGAYFDGRHIYPISFGWEYIKFDPSDRKIELEITADKDEYAPADKAEITVSAKDINGNAVEGASVIISVVDEAAFSVSPQNADPLGDIYAMIWPGYVTQYYSYIQHVEDLYGDGEKGGGEGEESIRKDFKDTALFEPVTTDNDGKCTVTIPLPDNITKWRVTAAAVKETETDVVYAGAAKSPVIATKPLFVSPVMLGKYVKGDDIAVTAKLFGASKGTKISVSILGNGVSDSLAITANETANFGKLDAGEYTVRFSAKENGSSDTVEMKLTVVDSLLEIPVTEEHTLAELSNLSPARWPISVTFFNDDYRLYAQTLLFLNFRLGDRLDMRIAHFYAMKELGFITEEEYKGEFGNIVSGGLAKLMDNSEGSPELTALICAAAPELINTASVTKKFNNITNNKESSHSDVANAYLGLAALNKPVLNSVKYALEHGEGFDIYDDLRLTAALAFLGDYDNAQKYYEKYASDIKYDGDKAYLNGDSPVELTQTALLAASLLHRPEADKMARYLLDGREVYDSYALELMVYVKNYHPEHSSDAVFTYIRDGQTKTVTLDKVFGTTVTFDKAQLEAAEFTEKSGKVYAVVNYTTGNIGKGDGDLTITKNLVSESGNFRKGEIVTVSIKASPFCCIYDVIPSCGRFNDCSRYCRENGQSIRLYTDEAGYACYSFRLITEGEYVVESAAAVSCEGYALSGRSEITVNG